MSTDNTPEGLSEAERFAIRQTLVAEWRDDYSVLSLVNALAVTVADLIAARTRMAAEAGEKRGAERALREAADEVDEGRLRPSRMGVANWLRARADRIAGGL